jgi:hypothetical protein
MIKRIQFLITGSPRVRKYLSIKNFAISFLLTAACGPVARPQLDSWLGAQVQPNVEFRNSDEVNSALANSALANAALANAALANAALANAALANAALANAALANSATFTGVYFSGITLASEAIDNVTVSSGKFSGVRVSDSAALNGALFKDAILKGKLSDDTKMDLRIDDVTHDSTFNVDWHYVSMSFDDGYSWWPLCPNGAGAIPLQNIWSADGSRVNDASLFTFACDGAALAKCFKWGYDPNQTRVESDGQGHSKTQSLGDWHQACARLVTADYCGDGVSHTRTGTTIDIYDNLNIQSRAGTLPATEADWAIDGAHCIRQTRWVNATGLGNDYDYVVANCPSRLAVNDVENCGTDPNQAPNVDITSFPSANGYSVDTSVRTLLRNDSYGYLP